MYEITDFEYYSGLVFALTVIVITIIAIIKGWH